jgi:ribosomal-protein-serine acetyltransferase
MPLISKRDADKTAIDELVAAFFDAFTNRAGTKPDLDRLYRLFIPQAIIIKNTGTEPEVYDVAGFAEPRRKMLTDGSLTEFSEQEVSERTEIFGNVAQRFCLYKKSWIASGTAFEGGGANVIQFVRTPAGWKIGSLAWDDVPPSR